MSDAIGTTVASAPAPTSTPSAPSTSKGPAVSSGPAKTQTTPSSTQSSDPFFKYKFDDGEEVAFKSQDELASAFRGGYLRHKDYTKKTQSHAEAVKAFEAQKKQHEETLNQINGMKSKYEPIDEFIKKNPAVYERLVREMKGPQARVENTQKYVDERTKALEEKIESLVKERETEKAQRDSESKRKSTFDAMKGRYEDFDENSVNQMVSSLYEGAPGDEMAQLVELIYWASKGKGGGAKMAEKITSELQRKSQLKPTMGDSPLAGDTGHKFKNIREAADVAKRNLRAG